MIRKYFSFLFFNRNAPAFILFLCSLFFMSCGREQPIDFVDDSLPPAVPTNLRIIFSEDGEALIAWDANSEYDFQGYKIFLSKNDTLNWFLIATTPNNYYFIDSLDYDSIYYIRVSAFDRTERESKFSISVSLISPNIHAPITPRGLEVFGRNWLNEKSFFLRWRKNIESDVKHYQIFRSTIENFIPDSSNLIASTSLTSFIDSSLDFENYKYYFYRIVAVDKGGLRSLPTNQVADKILPIPEIIFPQNNYNDKYFRYFRIRTLNVPTTYKIIVQTNEFFGEIWSKEINTDLTNETLSILFDADFIYPARDYFWRIITYTKDETQPNSISPLFKFRVN